MILLTEPAEISNEIGHFEYCDVVDQNGNCSTKSVNDPGGLDGDDTFCFPASASSRVKISRCANTEFDFDGESYQLVWPGSLMPPSRCRPHPKPPFDGETAPHGSRPPDHPAGVERCWQSNQTPQKISRHP